MSNITKITREIIQAVERKQVVKLPELPVFGTDEELRGHVLDLINTSGLARFSPRGAFERMVHQCLKRMPRSDVEDFIAKLDDDAFRAYTSTTTGHLKTDTIPIVVVLLIQDSEQVPGSVDHIVVAIQNELLRRGLAPSLHLPVASYFMLSFAQRDAHEKIGLHEVWRSSLPKLSAWQLFQLFNPINKPLIQWTIESGKSGAFDDDVRSLLNYYWVSVAYDRDVLDVIRHKMGALEKKLPSPDVSDPYRNSLEWIAHGRMNTIGAVAPKGIPQRSGRLRVAICVSGQMRGFEKAFPSWRKALSLEDVDYDIYVHTWRKLGRKALTSYHAGRNFLPPFSEVFTESWNKLQRDFPARYPALFSLFTALEIVDIERIKAVMNPQEIVVEEDDVFPETTPNTFRMHYKIEKCYELAVRSGKEYDLIVRIRPDKNLTDTGGIDWEKVYKAAVGDRTIFTDTPVKVGFPHGLVMGDQFIVADPQAAEAVFRIWSLPAALGQNVLGGYGVKFAEMGLELRQHYSFALLCHFTGRRVEGFPYPICSGGDTASLLDPYPIPSSMVRKALEKDTAGRMDEVDSELLRAAKISSDDKYQR
ncbi:hypothetical protein [Mycoplana sp. MJR14]|uniref:hypothetical protein n=1 Tax=Mycoplana sp. MJR14 TaxID=3032583 RepID=UPI0023DA587F|nr:hypothetical protein [Mycoplana sp. MJR14]MDF1631547.1 hypothetical protein [Mycoplana sp. MJR14]